MDKIKSLPLTALPHTRPKGTGMASVDDPAHKSRRSYSNKRRNEFGLVGLVNVGNSCYMNATLQALSNCPPFRQYFIDCHQQGQQFSTPRAADALYSLFNQIWTSERHPGNMSPRSVSSAMKNKMFKGTLQQDAQEFLRCLLSQIHEEIGLLIPPTMECVYCGCGQESCDHHCHRDSTMSCVSHDSNTSNDSNTKLVVSCDQCNNSPSPSTSPKFPLRSKGSYSKLKGGCKSSLESINLVGQCRVSKVPLPKSEKQGDSLQISEVAECCDVVWSEGDVFLADLETRTVSRHPPCLNVGTEREPLDSSSCDPPLGPVSDTHITHPQETQTSCVSNSVSIEQLAVPSKLRPPHADLGVDQQTPSVVLRKTNSKPKNKPYVVSIVSQVFEGILESKVTCLSCKKVSVIHEPFHDLSLPIPGRKEMAKFSATGNISSEESPFTDDESRRSKRSFRHGFCSVLQYVSTLTRDYITGPDTAITDCLNAFFDDCELKGDNKYYCCHCKSFQTSKKQMKIIRLPEVLCIHLKRFRFDSYFSSKISRHISFPMMGLDMSSYLRDSSNGLSHSYDLDAVITHYGGAGGGHYVAFARNDLLQGWYEFNDTRVHSVGVDTVQSAEGYVLFYRRVSSPPTRNLNLIDLLPQQSTVLPSPDVCYLSRHWLHLLRHCSHPGPIFQYEYACRHGGVIPGRTDIAGRKSVTVRKEVWDSFQSEFKGGPLVTSLDACQQCQEKDTFLYSPSNLEQLMDKRRKERDVVHQIHQNEKQALDREIEPEIYLLSNNWLHLWQKFTQSDTLDVPPPGPIDNTPLLQVDGANDDLSIVDNNSFRKLSAAVWTYFYKAYGGGPVIVTSLDGVSRPEVPTHGRTN